MDREWRIAKLAGMVSLVEVGEMKKRRGRGTFESERRQDRPCLEKMSVIVSTPGK